MMLATTIKGEFPQDRGTGRVAKHDLIPLYPADRTHLAASGRYNAEKAMWETLAETVEEASELETRALPLQWTPLQHAARHGSVEDVKQLLGLGAEIQTKDVHGATPLHNAVRSGDAVKVEALGERSPCRGLTPRTGFASPVPDAALCSRLPHPFREASRGLASRVCYMCVGTYMCMHMYMCTRDMGILHEHTPAQCAASTRLSMSR